MDLNWQEFVIIDPKFYRPAEVDLLISEHVGECYSCWRNNNCELQNLAWEYGVRSYKFGHDNAPRTEIDRSAFSVTRSMRWYL